VYLCSAKQLINSIKVHSTSPLLSSNHYSITFNLLLNKPSTKKTTYYSYNYSKGDYQGLYEHLLHTNLSPCFLPDYVGKQVILNAIRSFIPFNKMYCSHQPSWFTANIRHHIKCLRTLRHRYKRHPTDHEFLEEKLSHLKSRFKRKFPTIKPITSYTSSENLYQTTITISLSTSEISFNLGVILLLYILMMSVLQSDTDCANLFNCYFHSVFSGTPEQSNAENSMEPTDYISSISFTIYSRSRSVWCPPTKASDIDLTSPKILHDMCFNFVPTTASFVYHVSLTYLHSLKLENPQDCTNFHFS